MCVCVYVCVKNEGSHIFLISRNIFFNPEQDGRNSQLKHYIKNTKNGKKRFSCANY